MCVIPVVRDRIGVESNVLVYSRRRHTAGLHVFAVYGVGCSCICSSCKSFFRCLVSHVGWSQCELFFM